MIEGGAKRKNIRTDIRMAFRTAVLLERRIQNRPLALDDGDGFFIWGENLDQPKIDQLEQAVGRNFQIGGFDIAVNEGRRLAMQIGQGIGQLGGPIEHFGFAQKAIAGLGFQHQRPQVFARDEIHHQVFATIIGEVVGDLGEIQVVETRQNIGLALELLAGLAQNFFGQVTVVFELLQCAFPAIQTQIISQVDVTHPTLTNAFLDAVTLTQDLPRFERDWH